MLYKYNLLEKSLDPLKEVNFTSLNILERQDIEKWLEEQPDMVGEELLIITTEYNKFDKTKERLDLLALDKTGKIVVLELKRDDSGRNVELQAIKYAAYCSTFTLKEVIEERRIYLEKKGQNKTAEDIQQEIDQFIDNSDFEEIDDKPRIILISKEFRPEVTASVLWLRNFQIDISCVKLTPYKIGENEIGISSHKIIPLPEAEDYQIQVERKESGEKGLSRTRKEYLDFWTKIKSETEKTLNINLAKPPINAFYQITTGINKIHFEWIFQGRPRNKFGVELHFEKSRKDENIHNLNILKPYFDELEKKLNAKLEIEENWTKRWSRIVCRLNQGNIDEQLKIFAIDKMKIMYEFLMPKLEQNKDKFL